MIPVVRGVECPLLESTADSSFGLRRRIAGEFATARDRKHWDEIDGVVASLARSAVGSFVTRSMAAVRSMLCPAANACGVFKLVALACTVSASLVGCSAGFSPGNAGLGG